MLYHARRTLAVVTVLVYLAALGCSSTPNPERTVEDFWTAFLEGNQDRAEEYLSAGSPEVPGEVWEDDLTDDEMVLAFLGRLGVSVDGHKIDGDTATVHTVITMPDTEILLGGFIMEALGAAFAAAWSGVSDEDLEEMLREIFMEVLQNTPDVSVEHDVPLVLREGRWLIDGAFIPEMEMPDLPD